MKTSSVKYVLIATTFLTVGFPLAQDRIDFNQQTLHLQGQVADVFVEDLNADSALDILVLHNQSRFPDPHVHRFISIFFQKNNRFPDMPHQTLVADQGEIVFDVGDTDGDAIPELVFLKKDGIYTRAYTESGYTLTLHPVLQTPSAFPSHDPSGLRRYRFIQNLDDDAIPEFVIPHPHQFCIYSRKKEENYRLVQRLWTSPEFELSPQEPITTSFHLPSVLLRDFNGDTTPDLLFLHGDRLDVYIQHPLNRQEDRIPLTPPDLRYRMGARNETLSALEQLAPASATIDAQDLNGDGYFDVILSKASRATFTTNISQVQVYLNRNGRFDALPDRILTAENFGGEHIIHDFNDDGLQDVALLTFKIGFAQTAKFLVKKKVSNAYDLYLMRPDHTYPAKPDGKIAFSRRVKLDDLFGAAICQNFDGDFDGDGHRDCLIGTDAHELSIFPGRASGFYHKKASWKIHVPISPDLWVGNLNQEGRDDIVIWYPTNTALSHNVHIIWSEHGVSR